VVRSVGRTTAGSIATFSKGGSLDVRVCAAAVKIRERAECIFFRESMSLKKNYYWFKLLKSIYL
jgi:hypothetical protein